MCFERKERKGELWGGGDAGQADLVARVHRVPHLTHKGLKGLNPCSETLQSLFDNSGRFPDVQFLTFFFGTPQKLYLYLNLNKIIFEALGIGLPLHE